MKMHIESLIMNILFFVRDLIKKIKIKTKFNHEQRKENEEIQSFGLINVFW